MPVQVVACRPSGAVECQHQLGWRHITTSQFLLDRAILSFSVQVVTWVCDPVHGNTESVNGFKTRRYENVRAEVEAFFDVHDQMGSVPGGVHLEMTGAEGGGDCGHGRLVEGGAGAAACTLDEMRWVERVQGFLHWHVR